MRKLRMMVVLVTGIIFSLFSILLTSDWESRKRADEPKDVVDYFLRLPQCWFDEMRDTINIFEARKGYLISGDTRIVIIDIENGFLRIRDFEYELEEELTVTYFKKADGSKVIGFSEHYEGGDCDNYGVTFYEFSKNEWKDISEQVLPEIRFRDFWDEDTLLAVEQYILIDSNIHWNYELPRYGTTAKVSPEPLEAMICFEIDPSIFEYLGEDEFDMVLNDYYKIVRGRKYRAIELKWNREKGMFEIGEKIKGKGK